MRAFVAGVAVVAPGPAPLEFTTVVQSSFELFAILAPTIISIHMCDWEVRLSLSELDGVHIHDGPIPKLVSQRVRAYFSALITSRRT